MKKFALIALMALLAMGTLVAVAQDAEATAEPVPFSEEEIAASPYLQSVLSRKETTYDTTPFKKDGPYRIALAAQGTSNSWSALFDEHARWYAEELGPDVISELLYADAQASADKQVPQVEDLLAQSPDALILVPMGAAALSAPVERAMAQGVPVILCASTVDTDNFVTEVGTNLYASGAYLAQWLVDSVGGAGNVVVMTGIPGVSTSDVMEAGAKSVFDKNPDVKVLELQPGMWSTADAKQLMETWLAKYGDTIDGIWSGGAQMSQGIVSAYLDAGQEIPPIAGGEYGNGFLRLAIENEIKFAAWQYPNAQAVTCIDTALQVLRGEPVQRFIDIQDVIPEAQNFDDSKVTEYFNPEWSDDVFGPILFPAERLEALGFLVTP
ncbi:MAG: substrate-binding domain-containing protein [Chloroflexi bacterium]|nr:substrate-binding domain-containing protein [Chloroflexota bacterium]MCC6894834.1 substrate-binding domain-containing protein [Anaerolineae bacterium]